MRNAANVVALVVLAVFTGCRTAPVYNVPWTSIPTDSARSSEDVGRIIEAAALERDWTTERIRDGEIVATLKVRHHRAVVTISYDASHYQIRYKDSDVLLYDGKKIHRNYNHWIQALDARIQEALGA